MNRDFTIRESKKINDLLSEVINSLNLKTVGFESHLPYSMYEELKNKLDSIQLVPAKNIIEDIRIVKEPLEIELIRESIKITERAFRGVKGMIRQGSREDEIAIEMEYRLRKEGAEKVAFDTIIASGERGALPHGKASNKIIENGELVIVDFGSTYKGYNTDCTRTLSTDGFNARQEEIYKTVLMAQREAIKSVKPGLKASEIDSKARGFITDAGYGENFGHSTGHGVGLEVHEEPRIAEGQDDIIREGSVFTIEPGIYIQEWGGVRIEDMVVVTKDGCEVLTSAIEKEFEIKGE